MGGMAFNSQSRGCGPDWSTRRPLIWPVRNRSTIRPIEGTDRQSKGDAKIRPIRQERIGSERPHPRPLRAVTRFAFSNHWR